MRNKLAKSVKSVTERVNSLQQYGRRVNLEVQDVSVRAESLKNEEISVVVEGLVKDIGSVNGEG